MSAQHYWDRFSKANRTYQRISKCQPFSWRDRHLRLHREMAAGQHTLVRTGASRDTGQVFHVLTDADTGAICAAAIDTGDGSIEPTTGRGLTEKLPDVALPRSLPGGPLDPADPNEVLGRPHAMLVQLGSIGRHDCDHNGVLKESGYVLPCNLAANILWEKVGYGFRARREKQLGRAALEVKITRHATVRRGTAISVLSWIVPLSDKTLILRHQILDGADGTVLFSGAVTALIMGLADRKPRILPPALQP